MADAFSADKCAVYNFDETSGSLTLIQQYVKSTSNDAPLSDFGQDALPLALTKFPALQAAIKEHTLLTVRLDDSELTPPETEWLKEQNYGAMVAIPLISRDKVTGLVELFSTQPYAFTEDEIWLAQSLANQIN